MPRINRAYLAVTVTLTLADTNYNLYDLINAIVAAESGTATGSQIGSMCRELSIQSAAGNTAEVLIGDGKLSATRVGYGLVDGNGESGASRVYRADSNSVSIGDLYARSSAAGQKLNIEICGY